MEEYKKLLHSNGETLPDGFGMANPEKSWFNTTITPEFVIAHPEMDFHWGQFGLSLKDL